MEWEQLAIANFGTKGPRGWPGVENWKILTKEGLPCHLELNAGELRQPGLQALLADVTPWSDGVADNVDGDLLDRAAATATDSAAGHRRSIAVRGPESPLRYVYTYRSVAASA